MPQVISEVLDSMLDDEAVPFVQVVKDDDGVYHVFQNGELRHTPCSAEDVIRALSHYLQTEHLSAIKNK